MSSSAFTPSTTTVTNNVPVNVPIIEAQSNSYTPVITGSTSNPTIGTTTTNTALWGRAGDKMHGNYNLVQTGAGTAGSGIYLISIPAGYTIDTSKLPNDKPAVGVAHIYNGTNISVCDVLVYNSSNLMLSGTYGASGSGGSGDWGSTYFPLTNANTVVRMNFSIPVSQWAGSGTTTLATRAVEEYAWNSDPGVTAGTNYSNSVYYGNGPAGTPLLSYASTTNSGYNRTTYYCRFPSTIQATDKISLELSGDGGLTWNDASQFESSCFLLANGAYYGAQYIEKIDSTTVRIGFGNAGRRPDTTFGGVGSAWSTLSNHRWRVRKVSGGAQVGYPVSARNIVGDTSGSVVPVGMIGEQAVGTVFTTAMTSNVASNMASITLQPGVWELHGQAYHALGAATTIQFNRTSISSTSATVDLFNFQTMGQSGSAGLDFSIQAYRRVNISVPTTYYLVSVTLFSVSTCTGNTNSYLTATRIA